MIYNVYWGALSQKSIVSLWNKEKYPGLQLGEYAPSHLVDFAKHLRESKGDTFLMVVVNYQLPMFDQWVKDEQLEKYIGVKSGLITNPVHYPTTPNLTLIVMQSEDMIEQREKEIA